MTPRHSGSVKWRQTTVLIRSDIFDAAQGRGIDISSECNHALAGKLGIDYSQQKIPVFPGTSPVIIAKEPVAGASGVQNASDGKRLHPILNAEDPEACARLQKMKREPPQQQKPAPARVPPEEREDTGRTEDRKREKVPPTPAGQRQSSGKTAGKIPGKKGKDDPVRQFITKQIVRTDPGEGAMNRIAKDELYPVFVRWFKENVKKGGPVPDKRAFTIALKNRFAMDESTAEGVQYWNNVKLK